MDKLIALFEESYGLSKNAVLLAFDDGYLDHFKCVFSHFGLSDNEFILYVTKKLIGDISKFAQEVKPHTYYTMNRSDIHSNHRIIFDAVMACSKSFRYPFIREVLMYECISETEFVPALPEKVFQPSCFVDISNEMEEKIEIMKVFESKLGEHPLPLSERNIRALATYRGAMAGVEYAEAFQILKSYRFETL